MKVLLKKGGVTLSSRNSWFLWMFCGVMLFILTTSPAFAQELTQRQQLSLRDSSTMTNPYRLIESWPTLLPNQEWGAAIGLLPDNTGGLWMMFRSEPPINYNGSSGVISKSFGEG